MTAGSAKPSLMTRLLLRGKVPAFASWEQRQIPWPAREARVRRKKKKTRKKKEKEKKNKYLREGAIIDGGKAVLLGRKSGTKLFHDGGQGLLVPLGGQGHGEFSGGRRGEGVVDPCLDGEADIIQLHLCSIGMLRVDHGVLEDINDIS